MYAYSTELDPGTLVKFVVQRAFQAGQDRLARGDIVDLVPSRRTQTLVDTRYLLPADVDVADAVRTPANDVTDGIVRRQGRKPSLPTAKD